MEKIALGLKIHYFYEKMTTTFKLIIKEEVFKFFYYLLYLS